MVILADENIEHALITKLKEHFDVISIDDSHRGASDTEIAALAVKQNAIILTEDKDFGDLVFIHQNNHLSVVLLRYTFNERNELHEVLIHLLQQKSFELMGKFTTVTSKKIRTRNL
ncbi:MAG: toxin-antitoxin system, toxin component [Bacteroidetes bacterium]|nr:MAG: toxin-antitoxin system, toxin component [Bacteroidota bacterium]